MSLFAVLIIVYLCWHFPTPAWFPKFDAWLAELPSRITAAVKSRNE